MADENERVSIGERHKVDPAALLVGVFAVGAGPLLQSGQWSYVNTISALVVLVVVLFFTWPGDSIRSAGRLPWRAYFTYAAVSAFMTGIAASDPIQYIGQRLAPFSTTCTGPEPGASDVLRYLYWNDCDAGVTDQVTARGTQGGMIAAAIALALWFGTLLFLHRRWQVKAEEAKQDASSTPETVEIIGQSTKSESEQLPSS